MDDRDGGGVRGLAELITLQELMAQVNKTRRKNDELEPWQLFDLIGGTGTGGLIAIMLGRLHMSVGECISAYMDFSRAIFKPQRRKWNALVRTQSPSTLDEKTMQEVLRKWSASSFNLDDLMRNSDSPCKVFVITTHTTTNRPFILRSYENPQSRFPTIDCKIWEAARATAASSPFFERVRIEAKGSILEFGLSDIHNPIGIVYKESCSLWPDRRYILVSVGAGAAPRKKFSGRLGASIEDVLSISDSAETEALDFMHQLQFIEPSMETFLYRFSARNLADISLEEYHAVSNIQAAIQYHFRKTEMQDRLRRCAHDLSEINYEEKSDAVKQLEAQRAYELERQKFAEWLSPIDMFAVQSDIIAKLQEGTGTSLFATSEYQSWLRGEVRTLLYTGMPGSGKTVFASQVIAFLLKDGIYKDYPVLYFFADCRVQQVEQQTPVSIIANLLKQLIYYNRQISDQTRRYFEQHIKGRNRPTAEELLACIERESIGTPKIFIVIDALDELADSCPEEILSHLSQLQRKRPTSLMITSRSSFRIDQLFPKIIPDYKSLNIRPTQDDIEAYIVEQMHRLPDVVMRDADLQDHIKTEMMVRSDGRFIYAKLLLESIKSELTVRGIKSTLSSVPSTLSGFYGMIFRRIKEQHWSSRDLAVMVLTWLSYSQRPLTALELQHALAVESGHKNLDEENLVDVEELVLVCGGLVVVSAESNIFTFVHMSAREYFLDQRETQMATGQVAIASTCLTYLCFDCFANGSCANDEALQQRLKENPFFAYASHFWGNHIQQVSSNEIANQALELLTHDGRISSCSQVMLLPDSHNLHSSETSSKGVSGLHLVAYFGIEWLTHLLIDRGFDIHVRDSYGRDPLAWSVEYNHLGITKFLLACGADIEQKDNQGRTNLALAVMNGYRDITNYLLERGAEISARDFAGQTALSLAATYGHLLLLKLLLNTGSEPESRDDSGRTPLFYAADQGHDDIVVYLTTQVGVNINVQDERGATPLITSAKRGQIGVVKVLLALTSIDINMKDHTGRTAITWAAIEGQIEILQLLISREDAREALKSTDYSGRTPLDWAIVENQVPIRELLSSREKCKDRSND